MKEARDATDPLKGKCLFFSMNLVIAFLAYEERGGMIQGRGRGGKGGGGIERYKTFSSIYNSCFRLMFLFVHPYPSPNPLRSVVAKCQLVSARCIHTGTHAKGLRVVNNVEGVTVKLSIPCSTRNSHYIKSNA